MSQVSPQIYYATRQKELDRHNFNPAITNEARLWVVANLISQGLNQREIQQQLQAEWGVSYNYVQGFIQDALLTFKDDEIFKQIKEINNERLNKIYREAIEKGDRKNALKAIDLLNKTNGVYGDGNKVEVKNDNTNETITVTFGS